MTATMTVTPEPGNIPPRVRIDLTGASGPSVTVMRRTDTAPLGLPVPVRTANPGTLTSGAWTGYDYEAPFNTAVRYSVLDSTGAPVTLTSGADVAMPALREYGVQDPWLLHPGIPGISVKLDGTTLGDETREVTQGVHNVLGREEPIVVTDGMRRAPTFTLTCKARTKAADDALRLILGDAATLLLQYVEPGTDLADYYWVNVGSTTRHRVTQSFRVPYYLWTLPCTVTSAPAGLLQAQWTCAGVRAAFATCADVLASYATCHDLLIDNRAA